MKRDQGKPGGVGRREFIAGAGVCFTGTLATIVANASSIGESTEASVCRVLSHDEARCVGCGTCAMMCALYHDGEVGPTLSRSRIVRDPFSYDFSFDVCQQCVYPECYFACPLMGKARKIDRRTGVVYVDEDECIGCGSCIAACRFEPSRTTMHPEKRVAINCDRCMGRDEGPICVEYCNMYALSCSAVQRPRSPRRPLDRRGQSTHERNPG